MRKPFLHILLIIIVMILESACKVGPNFHSPALPDATRYGQTMHTQKTVQASSDESGRAQHFLTSQDIPLMWWELFHSEVINSLVDIGLKNNPTLVSATASLRQAQEQVNVQFGNALLPAVDTENYVQRQRYSEQQLGSDRPIAPTFNLFYSSVKLNYTLDVFGGAQRQLESLKAKVDYQQFLVIATYLTLTANIVTTAVTIASYSAQIEATKALIKSEQEILNILKHQYRLGGVSNADVLAQESILEQSKATLPPLDQQLAEAKHALLALLGSYPDKNLPTLQLDDLILPKQLPLSLPSKLVRQRPDIRASEALLHAASADVGVATSNLLPQFTISGSYGWLNDTITNLFTSPNSVWSVLAPVVQPIFHGGALMAERRASLEAYQQAQAQYRQTVLQAIQDVANVLYALNTDARTLQAQIAAVDAAQHSLDITREQYRVGATNVINLLNAEQRVQQIRLFYIQAEAARYTDTVALFQALGGGWWHKPWCDKDCLAATN